MIENVTLIKKIKHKGHRESTKLTKTLRVLCDFLVFFVFKTHIRGKKMIGATHEFHDQNYAYDWADRFEATPVRKQLFSDMGDLLEKHLLENHLPPSATVLELGIGPGFLAEYLLDRFPDIHYFGLDFSEAMLAIAQDRLSRFETRYQPLQLNLIKDNLRDVVPEPVGAVVSTWALHDLGSKQHIHNVYRQCQSVLRGILINGDFIKPEETEYDYEPGRIEVESHLHLLTGLGYKQVTCAGRYEINVTEPTSANNYACMVGYWTGDSSQNKTISIEPATSADLPVILKLLRQSDLPETGLSEHLATALVARAGHEIVGTVALELYGSAALLRSLAVAPLYQGQGWGRRLTEAALQLARQQAVTQIYLLTETAGQFFPKLGFRLIDRSQAPVAVQNSLEFTTLCPDSALAMERTLEPRMKE